MRKLIYKSNLVGSAQKLIILCSVLCLLSFGDRKKVEVGFQIVEDSITIQEDNGVFKYRFRITNSSKKTLVTCFELYGYEGDPGIDYYMELYKCAASDSFRYESELKHYMVYTCPIKDTFRFQESKHYSNLSYLNSISEPGKYYARLVFCNEKAFVGATNYDSIIVRRR